MTNKTDTFYSEIISLFLDSSNEQLKLIKKALISVPSRNPNFIKLLHSMMLTHHQIYNYVKDIKEFVQFFELNSCMNENIMDWKSLMANVQTVSEQSDKNGMIQPPLLDFLVDDIKRYQNSLQEFQKEVYTNYSLHLDVFYNAFHC